MLVCMAQNRSTLGHQRLSRLPPQHAPAKSVCAVASFAPACQSKRGASSLKLRSDTGQNAGGAYCFRIPSPSCRTEAIRLRHGRGRLRPRRRYQHDQKDEPGSCCQEEARRKRHIEALSSTCSDHSKNPGKYECSCPCLSRK